MLRRLRPTTRLTLAMVLLGWLLLQTMLPILGREPAMLDAARTLTKLLFVAIPVCVWLLKTFYPDADVPPKKLETLFMVAAFGFATTVVLRWLLNKPSAPDDSTGLAATA